MKTTDTYISGHWHISRYGHQKCGSRYAT